MLYAFGSPLLPLIRLRRVLKDAGRAQLGTGMFLRALMPAFLTLCVGSMGEMLGYTFGGGNAHKDLLKVLDKRDLFYTSRDLEAASKLRDTFQIDAR